MYIRHRRANNDGPGHNFGQCEITELVREYHQTAVFGRLPSSLIGVTDETRGIRDKGVARARYDDGPHVNGGDDFENLSTVEHNYLRI